MFGATSTSRLRPPRAFSSLLALACLFSIAGCNPLLLTGNKYLWSPRLENRLDHPVEIFVEYTDDSWFEEEVWPCQNVVIKHLPEQRALIARHNFTPEVHPKRMEIHNAVANSRDVYDESRLREVFEQNFDMKRWWLKRRMQDYYIDKNGIWMRSYGRNDRCARLFSLFDKPVQLRVAYANGLQSVRELQPCRETWLGLKEIGVLESREPKSSKVSEVTIHLGEEMILRYDADQVRQTFKKYYFAGSRSFWWVGNLGFATKSDESTTGTSCEKPYRRKSYESLIAERDQ